MRKILVLYIWILFFVCIANTGCTLTGGDIILPDISNLSITSVSTFIPGDSATVMMYSSSLTPGPYLVHYKLTGANVLSGLTAVVYINNDTGSFMTAVLDSPGNTTLTITEITTPSNGNAAISKNNTKTFTDSIGLMTAKINDTGSYRAMHVTATLIGTTLTIKGVFWNPLKTITISALSYTPGTGPDNYNIYGNATYSIPGKVDTSQYGVISISNNSTIISGTFSFTNKDSTKVTSGTFSCAAP